MKFAARNSTANKAAFGLLAFVLVFSTLAYGTVHQPAIALFYLLTGAIVVLWAVDGFVTGVFKYSRSLIQVPLAATVLYAFVQIIPFGWIADTAGVSGVGRTISIEPFWTQLFALHFLALLLFFAALLGLLDSAARIRRLTALITIFGFAFAFYAILQRVLSPTRIYGLYEALSPFGSFVNRHNFAAVMEMTIAVPAGLMFAGAIPKDKKLIYATAIGLMGVALALSGSRGGFVSIGAAVIFIALMASRGRERGSVLLKVGLTAALFVVIVAGAVLIGGETTFTRIAETAQSQDVTTNRTEIWDATISVIGRYTPFGAGIGAFAAAYTPYDPSNGSERVEQAHSDYLQVLADAGLVGLALLAFFIWSLLRTGLRSIATDNVFRRGVALGALGGCFSLLVHSLFDFTLHTTSVTLFFLTLTALVVAAGRNYKDDEHLYERKRRVKENVRKIRE